MDRKPSGIMLSVITLPAPHHDGMSWAGGVMAGHTLMLCSEGVMYDCTEYDAERMQKEWGVESVEILTARILLGDEGFIAPEDLVRTFGDRLEANYGMATYRMHELLSGEKN